MPSLETLSNNIEKNFIENMSYIASNRSSLICCLQHCINGNFSFLWSFCFSPTNAEATPQPSFTKNGVVVMDLCKDVVFAVKMQLFQIS